MKEEQKGMALGTSALGECLSRGAVAFLMAFVHLAPPLGTLSRNKQNDIKRVYLEKVKAKAERGRIV